MPAPPPSLIEALAMSAFQSAELRGQDAPGVAKATAKTTAQALDMFLSMAMVLPGIPVACDPITGSGSTAGPGMLMPPPAGGPAEGMIRPMALANLQAEGIKGEDAPKVAALISGTIAQGLTLFCAQVTVSPGIAVAGFVTSAPGRLM